MMISPDSYVESELKGKTLDEVLEMIRSLQQEMADIKSSKENGACDAICPSMQVRVDVLREYVAAAEAYYTSLGGEYVPSMLEEKAAVFDSNMKHITSITITYGGFFEGHERRTLMRDGNKIVVERLSNRAEAPDAPLYEFMSWDDLLEALSYIHMGEWDSRYENHVLDGIQWSVDIKYDHEEPAKHFSGSNRYPYNFDRFLETMEMA
ncbi:MAG: hypothetical protein E7300_12685 [Lachnospiraceae bacterium]|jgi:hypothetical protein|nr:hypothetical protein [Lachnospiraceae bacterium]